MRNWVRLRNVGSDRRMRVPRDGGTWPRCRRAARPGRVPRQHIEPHASTPGTTGAKGTGGYGGHGRASRRRAERSSQRGRLAGGLPPTAQHGPTGAKGAGGSGGHGRASRSTTPSRRLACGDLAGGRALRRPARQRRNTPPRHNKAARPHRGRAAQPGSEAHRRTTTMSGSPRPLSWRTLEIPSLAATSFAVPSMRGSS